MALRGKAALRAPRFLLFSISIFGDLMACLGKTFPLTGSRYRNMISDYLTPMDKTFVVLGEPPFDLEGGIEQSIGWLEAYSPDDEWMKINE